MPDEETDAATNVAQESVPENVNQEPASTGEQHA
jgi:hypothetical protein